jgi:hypothetical protein
MIDIGILQRMFVKINAMDDKNLMKEFSDFYNDVSISNLVNSIITQASLSLLSDSDTTDLVNQCKEYVKNRTPILQEKHKKFNNIIDNQNESVHTQ